MNPKFDPRNNSMQPSPNNPPEHSSSQGQSPLNTLQRDRFELLSAYLDGEVTATERKQVEEWLSTDASIQKLHARLLNLRQSFRSIPAPPPSQPVEQTVTQVLTRLDRRPKLSLLWGGTAIAALFIGAAALFSPQLEMAWGPKSHPGVQIGQSNSEEPDGLMIALDRPVLNMPKNATAGMKAPNGVIDPTQDAH